MLTGITGSIHRSNGFRDSSSRDSIETRSFATEERPMNRHMFVFRFCHYATYDAVSFSVSFSIRHLPRTRIGNESAAPYVREQTINRRLDNTAKAKGVFISCDAESEISIIPTNLASISRMQLALSSYARAHTYVHAPANRLSLPVLVYRDSCRREILAVAGLGGGGGEEEGKPRENEGCRERRVIKTIRGGESRSFLRSREKRPSRRP